MTDGAELESRFFDNQQMREDLTVNLLIVPWPLSVRPKQFRPNDRLTKELKSMPPDKFGFFTYDSRPVGRSFVPALEALLAEAKDECGGVNMVILPELALGEIEAEKLSNVLNLEECALVTGIGAGGRSGLQRGANRVRLYAPGLEPVEQEKHHRWKLDRHQVLQYSLGNSLHHETVWWEHIGIATRRLSFVRLAPWLTLCTLICEDLARPDPAGDAIRAIGPNLVIALLMDGPQTVSRWASRHATTLAEDPGSSVLTLTSLGMAQLSRPARGGVNKDRVIALWKEEDSDALEIELPKDRTAAVLSLSMKACRDWAADGRVREAAIPSLTGVHFLKGERLTSLG